MALLTASTTLHLRNLSMRRIHYAPESPCLVQFQVYSQSCFPCLISPFDSPLFLLIFIFECFSISTQEQLGDFAQTGRDAHTKSLP